MVFVAMQGIDGKEDVEITVTRRELLKYGVGIGAPIMLGMSGCFTPGLTPTISVTPTPTNNPKPVITVGVCYSPFRDGQSPDTGQYPTTDQIKEDMKWLAFMSKRLSGSNSANPSLYIRTYGASQGL